MHACVGGLSPPKELNFWIGGEVCQMRAQNSMKIDLALSLINMYYEINLNRCKVSDDRWKDYSSDFGENGERPMTFDMNFDTKEMASW